MKTWDRLTTSGFLRELRAEVQAIEECAKTDDERAHSMEDALRERVLDAIRDGLPSKAARVACDIALSTADIEFGRWCA